MVIVKVIRCGVSKAIKERFISSQSRWGKLTECTGFRGQFGGWIDSTKNSTEEAIIIGLWENQDAVKQFMAHSHDDIVESSEQASTYNYCKVDYYEHLDAISDVNPSLSNVKIIRVAHCKEVTDSQRFKDELLHIWNPGVLGQKGMLGGHVLRHSIDPNHYMVLSFWSSEEAHKAYQTDTFPNLKSKASPEQYIKQLSGGVIYVEHAWDVTPKAD